jgi:hypothetical protein
LSHPLSAELRTEESNQVDWNRLIHVEQKSTHAGNQQRPKQTIG